MIPLSIYSYLFKGNRYSKWVYSILLLCLLCTRTRAAWLGFIFSMMVYLFFYFRFISEKSIEMKRIVTLLVLTIVVIAVFNVTSSNMALNRFLSIFSDAFKVATQTGNVEATGSYRFFIWKRVVKLIAMKPWFGHGIEHLQYVFNNYFRDDIFRIMGGPKFIERAHNEYLHIAVSSGIPATLTYISFVVLAVRKGIARIVQEKNTMLLPFLAAVCGYLLQALFANSIVSVAYIYWIFLGILVSGEFVEPSKSESSK